MLFGRKKDVDLRDLQRKGLIRIPKEEIELETDRNGFVDLRSEQLKGTDSVQDNLTKPAQEPGFFNMFDSASSSNQDSAHINSVSSEKERRETTRRLEELDNKIYKLEQRIELLERKTGVSSSSGYSW